MVDQVTYIFILFGMFDHTLFLTWWRHQMETFSALLAICAGNSPATGEFPTQRPVTRSFDVFFDLRLSKRLRKMVRLEIWDAIALIMTSLWWFRLCSHIKFILCIVWHIAASAGFHYEIPLYFGDIGLDMPLDFVQTLKHPLWRNVDETHILVMGVSEFTTSIHPYNIPQLRIITRSSTSFTSKYPETTHIKGKSCDIDLTEQMYILIWIIDNVICCICNIFFHLPRRLCFVWEINLKLNCSKWDDI